MPRPGVTSQFAEAMALPVIRPCYFVSIQFRTETLFLWSGRYSTTWNGNLYYASGSLLGITGMSEDSTVTAKNVTISLSGVSSEIAGMALTEVQRGLPAQVYLGLFEPDGVTLIPNPVLIYNGRTDQPSFSIAGDSCKISMNCENILVDMNRSVFRRYTDSDQQLDFPGDLGCSYVQAIQEQQIFFGNLPQSTNN